MLQAELLGMTHRRAVQNWPTKSCYLCCCQEAGASEINIAVVQDPAVLPQMGPALGSYLPLNTNKKANELKWYYVMFLLSSC